MDYVLREIGQINMRKALSSLPSNPSEAYEQVMAHIRQRGQYSRDMALATLAWVFHAARPLRMIELREALVVQLREGDPDLDENDLKELLAPDIVESCFSLVIYEKDTKRVRFSHPTVQDFLASEILPVAELAITCLHYFQLKVFSDGPCANENALIERLKKYQFSHYAAKFWAFHTRAHESDPKIKIAIFRVLLSKVRRQSLIQIPYVFTDINSIQSYTTITALHLRAKNGLASSCRSLFERDSIVISACTSYVSNIAGLSQ